MKKLLAATLSALTILLILITPEVRALDSAEFRKNLTKLRGLNIAFFKGAKAQFKALLETVLSKKDEYLRLAPAEFAKGLKESDTELIAGICFFLNQVQNEQSFILLVAFYKSLDQNLEVLKERSLNVDKYTRDELISFFPPEFSRKAKRENTESLRIRLLSMNKVLTADTQNFFVNILDHIKNYYSSDLINYICARHKSFADTPYEFKYYLQNQLQNNPQIYSLIEREPESRILNEAILIYRKYGSLVKR